MSHRPRSTQGETTTSWSTRGVPSRAMGAGRSAAHTRRGLGRRRGVHQRTNPLVAKTTDGVACRYWPRFAYGRHSVRLPPSRSYSATRAGTLTSTQSPMPSRRHRWRVIEAWTARSPMARHLPRVSRRWPSSRQKLARGAPLTRERIPPGGGPPVREISGESSDSETSSRQVENVAPTDADRCHPRAGPAGDELMARAIHDRVAGASGLVKIPTARPSRRASRELAIRHRAGASSPGPLRPKIVRFESVAPGGTLFLDEVGEIPIDATAEAIRVNPRSRRRERLGAPER